MQWRELKLGDAIRVKHGFAFKGKYFADTGTHIVLTPGNFHEKGGFRLRPGKDRYYNGDIPDGYILDEGDLIIAMTEQGPGLLGSSALIPEGVRCLHNQRLGLVEVQDKTALDLVFLYHLFNSNTVREQITASATGTKVRHTAPERIYSVSVSIPSRLDEQRRIGEIISSYDEMIENNRRRIGLLKRTARLLYDEWFIHFRFPGYKHIRIVNGIPGGWERRKVGAVAELRYGKALKEEIRVPGPFPVYGSSGIIGFHETALVGGPAVVVGRKGNVGSIHWCDGGCWPIDTVYYVPRQQSNLWLYHALPSVGFLNTHAGVPGLSRDFAYSREITVPPAILRQSFNAAALPLFSQAATLRSFNESLTQARDLLLPCLMSGAITV